MIRISIVTMIVTKGFADLYLSVLDNLRKVVLAAPYYAMISDKIQS